MQPSQPMYRDKFGVVRFKPNKIIEWLFETERLDLNMIAAMDFPREDRAQLAQQLGYSVSGFGDLSYVSRKQLEAYDKAAAKFVKARRKR